MNKKHTKYFEELSRLFVENFPGLVCYFEQDGTITFVNDGYCEYFNRTREELVGSSIFSMILTQDREGVASKLSALTMKAPMQVLECRVIAPDGNIRWQRWTNRAWFYKDGRVLSHYSLVEDITELKKTEANLHVSEQNYRILVEQASDGIAAIQDEKIKFVNSYIADLLGYTIEELLDSPFMDHIAPAELPKAVDNYRRRMRGEDSLPVYESVLMHKDGSRLEVEFNAGIATFDGKPADIVIVRDITKRKRIEEERDRILDLTLDMVCVADFDGYLKYINPAWEKTLGYTNDELFEKPFLSFIHQDDQASTVAEIKKLASGQPTVNFENRYVHKDGSIRHLLWIATPIPEEKVMYAIARNISDRKKAEKEVDRYMNRLKALALQLTLTEERERRKIAADLHDNIGHLLALSRLQLDAVLDAASYTERAVLVNDISNILLKAIQDSKNLIFELSSPLVNEIGLSAALSEWLEEYMERRYGLETELIDNSGDISLGNDLRAILFRNVRELFTNIIKHAKAKKVNVILESTSESYIITVTDDGIGFDLDQVSKELKQEGGFGLFSVEERMIDLGGSMEILSKPGHGTKIILSASLEGNTSGKLS